MHVTKKKENRNELRIYGISSFFSVTLRNAVRKLANSTPEAAKEKQIEIYIEGDRK